LELTQKGIFQSILEEIYAEGWRRNWKVGEADTMTSLELFLASKSLSTGTEPSDSSISSTSPSIEEDDQLQQQQQQQQRRHSELNTHDDTDNGIGTMNLKQSSHVSSSLDSTESSHATAVATTAAVASLSDKLPHTTIADALTTPEMEGAGLEVNLLTETS
jgi:hypothetical protein